MADPIKVCVDPVPLPELLEAADGGDSNQELALLRSYLWTPGQTLRVRFLDGLPEVQAKVEQYAHQWSQYANIRFNFGDHPVAEIRISFEATPGRSSSHHGNYALQITDQNEPTMNYGWLFPNSDEIVYAAVVLHEFGHALGCIHEHQHPEAGIPFDREAVYAYFMSLDPPWTKEEVDHNLFRAYSRTITQFSQFDVESIMLYPIPQEHTIGDFEVGWNTKLSATDKAYIAEVYPF